ncbi:MAG: flippase-like domain-containing protein [Bacteroides sp.]|jgi:uncharacterized protein (TIRG00374 family)|nr:flippase-like domain-containing protein [Bacteroides sp.]MCI1680998.1 flippase-like domain-containing protein [Bacteroides sp.]
MRVNVLKTYYIVIPSIIGLSVIGWLFCRDFDSDLFSGLCLSTNALFFILLAFLCIAGRDIGQIYRFRILSDKALNFKQSFRVNMLCEFTSAVTPSVVGGSSLIVLFLNKEGINAGKGVTMMMACLFLDELFLTLAYPIILLFLPLHRLFGSVAVFSSGMQILFWTVYICILAWTSLIYTALFHKPHWVKALLVGLFSFPWLKRWNGRVQELADHLIVSSKEMKNRSLLFWLKTFGWTCFAWISRYLVVNALLLAFAITGHAFIAFARQLVLWIVMIVSPTPGGSGVAEYMFRTYYGDFFAVSGVALLVAFLWRIVTYYPYLIIGAIILPKWVGNLATSTNSSKD